MYRVLFLLQKIDTIYGRFCDLETYMSAKFNYQKVLDQILEKISVENKKPSLFLHSCCAPCSSYVLEYLSPYFAITVFYYNPNIYPLEEYDKRVQEQELLIQDMGLSGQVSFQVGQYDQERFYQRAAGLEDEREGGNRCLRCYQLRLEETAKRALQGSFDYFTTTLSISPLKNAEKLNEIGLALQDKYNIAYLQADFKKKNGYKRSIELSNEFGLYRQDYCGCQFSLENQGRVG